MMRHLFQVVVSVWFIFQVEAQVPPLSMTSAQVSVNLPLTSHIQRLCFPSASGGITAVIWSNSSTNQPLITLTDFSETGAQLASNQYSLPLPAQSLVDVQCIRNRQTVLVAWLVNSTAYSFLELNRQAQPNTLLRRFNVGLGLTSISAVSVIPSTNDSIVAGTSSSRYYFNRWPAANTPNPLPPQTTANLDPSYQYVIDILPSHNTSTFYLLGLTQGRINNQNATGTQNPFLVRFNGAAVEWTRVWGSTKSANSSAFDTPVGLLRDEQRGGVFVYGYSNSPFDGQPNVGGRDAFVTKFSDSGDKLWSVTWGTTLDETVRSGVFDTVRNEIYIAGQTRGKISSFTGYFGKGDIFITRLSGMDGSVTETMAYGSSAADDVSSLTLDPTTSTLFLAGTGDVLGTSGMEREFIMSLSWRGYKTPSTTTASVIAIPTYNPEQTKPDLTVDFFQSLITSPYFFIVIGAFIFGTYVLVRYVKRDKPSSGTTKPRSKSQGTQQILRTQEDNDVVEPPRFLFYSQQVQGAQFLDEARAVGFEEVSVSNSQLSVIPEESRRTSSSIPN